MPKKQQTKRQPAERDRGTLTIEDLSPESRRQIEDSLQQEARGEKPVAFRDILAAQREGHSS